MMLIPYIYEKSWNYKGFEFVTTVILRYGYERGSVKREKIVHKISIITKSEHEKTRNMSDYGSFVNGCTDENFDAVLKQLEEHAIQWADCKFNEFKGHPIAIKLKESGYKRIFDKRYM